MIRHIVAWNFKEGFSDEENRANAERIKKELESLKNLIPELVEIKVDIDLAPSSTRDVMLNSLFASEADLAVYQDHPEHKKAGAFIGSVTKHRVCLDFYE